MNVFLAELINTFCATFISYKYKYYILRVSRNHKYQKIIKTKMFIVLAKYALLPNINSKTSIKHLEMSVIFEMQTECEFV